MAKGGYQKRRIQNQKQAAREARKRAARRKKVMTVLVSVIVLGLIGSIALVAIVGPDEVTPAASPTPSLPTGCTPATPAASPPKTYTKAPPMTIDRDASYTATMETSCGTITLDLFAKDAPKTVNSFVFLARAGYYDGSPFHRVIADFGGPGSNMIQGGDAVRQDGTGDPGYSFGDENMIAFDEPGYIAMANSGPGTNGSQFFLLDGTVSHLNVSEDKCPGQGCHSVFGQVTDGLDVLGLIAIVPKDPTDGTNSKPLQSVVLTKVTITEK